MRIDWKIIAGMALLLATPMLAQAEDTGSLSGRITFAGTAAAPKRIEPTKDVEVCGKQAIFDESLVVSPDKGVKNVVVIVEGAKGGTFASPKAVLDQKGCVYAPHVVVVPTTGELDILNSDGVLHNIHSYSTLNPPFNVAQPKFKKVVTEKFSKPEIIKATCDAHNWMQGWIVATDTPFVAVSDAEGRFTMRDLPPGHYKVEIWQETLGKQVKDVSIRAKEDTKLNVELVKK
jgi:hypothetical protein